MQGVLDLKETRSGAQQPQAALSVVAVHDHIPKRHEAVEEVETALPVEEASWEVAWRDLDLETGAMTKSSGSECD